jgi:hypothetical protein
LNDAVKHLNSEQLKRSKDEDEEDEAGGDEKLLLLFTEVAKHQDHLVTQFHPTPSVMMDAQIPKGKHKIRFYIYGAYCYFL